MTRARSQQVSLEDTPYYHCISRCVRRAYLCGDDVVTGRNFDHRKRWLVQRIKELASHFSIDVCAYAVMSNHYHLVLHVDQDKARAWTDDEVIEHWSTLFPGHKALIETLTLNKKTKAAQKMLERRIKEWRARLTDISWFMRCLNESVARRANREDDCKGRFWEGRFRSQALLDEKALVTCMAYVDLNPIRAGLTETLDSSDFTSIQERLIDHAKRAKKRNYRQHRLLTRRSAKHLLGRKGTAKQSALKSLSGMPGMETDTLPINQQNYFELLETTCKALSLSRQDKHRALQMMDEKLTTLQSIKIGSESWLEGVLKFHRFHGVAAGSEQSLVLFHRSRMKSGVKFKHKDKWIRGTRPARSIFAT